MTPVERNQIAALAKEVAALSATMTNEFEHVNRRLDSHSNEIKGLASDMAEVKQSLAVNHAVNCYRQERDSDELHFWRDARLRLVVMFGSWFLSAVVGGWLASVWSNCPK